MALMTEGPMVLAQESSAPPPGAGGPKLNPFASALCGITPNTVFLMCSAVDSDATKDLCDGMAISLAHAINFFNLAGDDTKPAVVIPYTIESVLEANVITFGSELVRVIKDKSGNTFTQWDPDIAECLKGKRFYVASMFFDRRHGERADFMFLLRFQPQSTTFFFSSERFVITNAETVFNIGSAIAGGRELLNAYKTAEKVDHYLSRIKKLFGK